MDPEAPKERLHHLVGVTKASTVLCSPQYSHKFNEVVDNSIPLDKAFLDSLRPPPQYPENRAESHNAVYIIPTSGTTGQPKLTQLEHGNFCSGAKAHYVGLGMDVCKPLRVLQFAAHSFDASITEILTPLMVGGTICIPDEQTRLNDVTKAMNNMQVTYAQLTPTFVRFLEPSMVPSLATIVLMGEAMSKSNVETWSKINLVNG